MHSFSNLYRKEMLDKLLKKEFDLVVIGGGITGAGIALDAASRGMSVALLEKGDFASGTSSKSTKLIHGGLRYLKQFDFWLVKEVGTERAVIHKLAPHLVVPEKMLLPIIENGSYGSWLTSVGLKIYDILASVEDDDRRQMLDKEEALSKEPLLPEKILEGAGYYAEYRTDDARLTTEVLKTAYERGALVLNYCEVKRFLFEDEIVNGVVVKDHISNKEFNLRAKYVVNATGPWVDEIRDRFGKEKLSKRLQPTKGVHLVFPFEKFPIQQSIYFDVPDGRMIFGIPRGKTTYVGTTDTPYFNDLDEVKTELVDAVYLINAVNQMFPDIELKLEDIESSWAGLRPLICEEGKSASELSRKDEIFEAPNGLISIAGGKLTGYRKMAERIVDLVAKRFSSQEDLEFRKVQTENIPLTKRPFPNYKAVKAYINETYKTLEPLGFSKVEVKSLVHRYGRQIELILDRFSKLGEIDHKTDRQTNPETNHDTDHEVRMALAEVWYCVNYEMVVRALDFFERRTGRLYFESPSIEKLKTPVIEEMARLLNWDDATKTDQLKQLSEILAGVKNFS